MIIQFDGLVCGQPTENNNNNKERIGSVTVRSCLYGRQVKNYQGNLTF